mgnify:CR=1 FL=1
MVELYDAHRQLFSRPDDERHATLDALIACLEDREARTHEERVDPASLELWALDDRLLSLQTSEGPVHMTDWLFSQVCRLSGAPPDFINKLPGPLAAEVLNTTRRLYGPTENLGRVLVTTNGERLGRGIYSDIYVRIPDLEVARLLRDAAPDFRPGGEVAGRGMGGPAVPGASGLYAGDRDLFAFLVRDDDRIQVRGQDLGRGLMVWNSEVTCRRIGYQTFLYDYVCANHIVWGAQEVVARERRHVGHVRAILDELLAAIAALRARGTVDEERALVRTAIATRFADDEQLAVASLREAGFTKAVAEGAAEIAVKERGDLSVWSVVAGLTAQARDLPNAGDRVELERAAGRLLETLR